LEDLIKMENSKDTQGKRQVAKRGTDMKYRIPLSDKHPNHEQHLCSIVTKRNMKTVAQLAKDAKYLCLICGRSAKKETSLCWPIEF
jgi:hypothetical protein